MSDNSLTREEIIEHLTSVAELLASQGSPRSVIVVVGGAYLALRASRASTADVDLVVGLDDTLRTAVAAIARERDLSPEWLNDRAAPYAPIGLRFDMCEVLYEHPSLLVLGPPADFVFLMKLFAARAPDYDDMISLWPLCTFGTAEEAVRRYLDAYPAAPNDPYLVEFVQEIAAAASS